MVALPQMLGSLSAKLSGQLADFLRQPGHESYREVRAALTPEEARVAELAYDVEPRGEMHHNPAKNVLWIARTPGEIAASLGLDEATVRLTLACAISANQMINEFPESRGLQSFFERTS